MKIILADEGFEQPEKFFDEEIVRIGRDASECQIVFEREKFPMVSRRHAELRLTDGIWFLHDSGSSNGTFINGQKITTPQPVSIGQKLQFGAQGPVLRVVRFELNSAAPREDKQFQSAPVFSQTPPNVAPIDFSKPASPPNVSNQIKSNAAQNSKTARLEFLDSKEHLAPFPITKNSVWLGRDPAGDVVFQSSAVMVSRRHAEIKRENDGFILTDNNSFNGTLVNEQRISAPKPLYHGDLIQLGLGGPVLRFDDASQIVPEGANLVGQRSVVASQIAALQSAPAEIGSKTMVANLGNLSVRTSTKTESVEPQLLLTLSFGGKSELVIGRAEASDIKLDGLQISNRHARLLQTASGIIIEDLNSTNGVYVNGNRINRETITPDDAVQIGSFVVRVDMAGNVGVFDTRSKTRVDAVKLTKYVKNRTSGVRLLDSVSLSIQPNEFVGIIGASGAGKSTLLEAMNGARPASSGSVLINNLDFYRQLDSLKQSIGYVPQEDIIHRELTVYETLFFVAKLRLSRDVSEKEIKQIVDEVLDVTDLTERRNIVVAQLSGGQRKRVSIAVELITKPSIIFLDEPTSGLDPSTEEKIMRLFRQIAESGRTVILTTHAMENIKLFDKIVVLMRGKLIFYGKPDEALEFANATNFKEIFDKLEEPIQQKLNGGEANRPQITEQVADEWRRKFSETPQYKKNIYEPLAEIGKVESRGVNKKRRLGVIGTIRQTATLARRYSKILARDKFNLFILFIQAPIIALLTFFVMGENQPRDFVYFVLSLIAVWFGISVSAREIVRERAVYKRERMVNLGLVPYIFSKLFVLGFVVGLQCLLLFLPLKFFDIMNLMPMPGEFFGVPQFWTMLLTAAVGIALGLLISALVKTSETATSLVPLVLIPQILFSGLVGVPHDLNKAIGLTMPAAWSFDTMKRFSALDTLEKEGADPNGKTNGLGLYKYIETENDKIIADAERELNDYKKNSQDKLETFAKDAQSGNAFFPPQPDQPPTIADTKKLPENLSKYVTFLHPWMNEILNQAVLMLMFGMLLIATLFVLRLQDGG